MAEPRTVSPARGDRHLLRISRTSLPCERVGITLRKAHLSTPRIPARHLLRRHPRRPDRHFNHRRKLHPARILGTLPIRPPRTPSPDAPPRPDRTHGITSPPCTPIKGGLQWRTFIPPKVDSIPSQRFDDHEISFEALLRL